MFPCLNFSNSSSLVIFIFPQISLEGVESSISQSFTLPYIYCPSVLYYLLSASAASGTIIKHCLFSHPTDPRISLISGDLFDALSMTIVFVRSRSTCPKLQKRHNGKLDFISVSLSPLLTSSTGLRVAQSVLVSSHSDSRFRYRRDDFIPAQSQARQSLLFLSVAS